MNNGSIYIPQLGRDLFLKVANMVTAVIGNSSAGILETKFINKPTLDIMPRQAAGILMKTSFLLTIRLKISVELRL